jgi:predicted peroxiredoxin
MMKQISYKIGAAVFVAIFMAASFGFSARATEKKKTTILFHSFVGSENPTRACLPFLQAVANKERGDEVEIALAGDAVVLMRDAVINSVNPVGWPPLKETFQKVVQYGIPINV